MHCPPADYLAEPSARRPSPALALEPTAPLLAHNCATRPAQDRRFLTDPRVRRRCSAGRTRVIDATTSPRSVHIRRELGRESLTFGRADRTLAALWSRLAAHPEAKLKRDLWDGLLREVYGVEVGDDRLFLQHSYLTVVAKTIAARVLDLPAEDASAILSGGALADIGIRGAVEGDFFDWVLLDAEGRDLVLRLARQANRFRLRDVQSDVLKALYESLIDPEQRHDLGEYYTPDWLAAKVVAAAVDRPLDQRVLDPACGSGTFLFHAIRRLRAAGAALPPAERVRRATAQVRGLDVHPVAVIIARVTWLLALGEDIHHRDGDLHVPVFLGDALQWNISQVGDAREVRVPVPQETRPLRVPAGFAEDQALLDAGVEALKEGLERGATKEQVARDLSHLPGVARPDVEGLAETYAHLLALYRAGRNGIWPFVMRNLTRPLWLSRPEQQADVLVGNPPWVAFRHLSAAMQARLKDAKPGDEPLGRRRAGDAAGPLHAVHRAGGAALSEAGRADRLRAALCRAEPAGACGVAARRPSQRAAALGCRLEPGRDGAAAVSGARLRDVRPPGGERAAAGAGAALLGRAAAARCG